MSVFCTSCEGWGCTRCALERQERAGGEQGLSADELAIIHLREELHDAKQRVLRAEVAAAEAQRERETAVQEKNDVLVRFAMLSRGGIA